MGCHLEKHHRSHASTRYVLYTMQCFVSERDNSSTCFSNWLAVIFVMTCLLSVWKEIRLFAGIFLVRTQCYRWIAERIDTDMGQHII